jgi:hypothetical protein
LSAGSKAERAEQAVAHILKAKRRSVEEDDHLKEYVIRVKFLGRRFRGVAFETATELQEFPEVAT